MNRYQRGKISSQQLFCILFVSRIVVTLTYIQNVSVGKLSSDLLISVAIAFAIALLLCLPTYACIKNNKNPFDVKWVAPLYGLFFLLNATISLTRFSYFATSRFNAPLSIGIYAFIVVAAGCYAASLGIEPLGRFGAFCVGTLVLVMLMGIGFNIKNIDLINLYPIFENSRKNIFMNSIILATNTVEPALLLALNKRVNGNSVRSLFFSVSASFVLIFALIFSCMGVMGSGASLQAYPIFALFQMASIGSLSRLDMMHTAFWMLSLLLKTAIFIYCASLCTERLKFRTKVFISSVICFAGAIAILTFVGTKTVSVAKTISVCIGIAFLVAIPLIRLGFNRKENALENF